MSIELLNMLDALRLEIRAMSQQRAAAEGPGDRAGSVRQAASYRNLADESANSALSMARDREDKPWTT